MWDVLVRGVSERTRVKVQRIARFENLSVNQVIIQFIKEGAEREEKQKDDLRRHAEAMKRLKEIREEMHKKYGMMEDSWKLIREDRDSR